MTLLLFPDVPLLFPDVPLLFPDVPLVFPDVPLVVPDVPLVLPDVPLDGEEVVLAVGVELAEPDALALGVAWVVVLGFGFGDGVLEGQPVELVDGVLLALLPPPVAFAVELVEVVAVLLGLPLALVLAVELGLALAVPVFGGAAELAGVTFGRVDGFDELDEVVFAELDFVELEATRVDAHDGPAGTVWPAVVPPGPAPATPEDGPEEPCPSALPPPLVVLGPVIPRVWPSVTIPSRNGGTTARATPTVNTAMPTARAGLSIASRQSLGR